MDKLRLKYAVNAIVILTLIIAFAYYTTYIHELGHAIAILTCGGDVLMFHISSPLSFDSISGYVITNLPYNVPIVIGGTLATTALALAVWLTARRTALSYLMFCLSACTLYNAVYALSGFNDFTWLVTYAWWSALLSLGFVVLNGYIAHQGLKDMLDDMRDMRTLGRMETLANVIRHPHLLKQYPIKEEFALWWEH